MPSIGAIQCSIVRGNPRLQTERVELYQVPGIDSYGVHLIGKGDGRWRASAVLYSTPSLVELWYQSIQSQVGSLVIITNDWGVQCPQSILIGVSPLRKTPNRGESGCRGETVLELVSMS